MIDVPVIKAFTHEGRAYKVGDTARVLPVVALVLDRQKCVSLTRGYRAAVVVAPEPVRPRRRRSYRRRDLQAETAE